MKNKLILLGFLVIINPILLNSQDIWVAYSQSIQLENYEGLQFRLQASVRTEIVEDSASARLFVRVDKENGVGFFDNMWLEPIRKKEWDTYAIQGVIDTGAYQIEFGAICQYNGKFFYDDFRIDIEIKKNQWKNIFLADFEKYTSENGHGFQKWERIPSENFSAEVYQDDTAKSGNCLQIVGNGVPNFGVNNEVGKFANVNGIQLYYEVYGNGQPLIVLHGNGGSIASASSHYPHFIDNNYKVVAVDSRAQGKSGDSETELTYDLLASDLNELLNQLNLDSVYIWGHSDGAIIGLVMALKYPKKVKKLVAFAPNIVADTTGIEPPIYRWIEKTALTSENHKERKLNTMMWKHPNIPFSELKRIQTEVLLMSGDRDFVPLTHTIRIFKSLPKANLCIIPGSTHGASLEKKELFLQIVDDFFEKPFNMPSTIQWYEDK